MMREEASAVLIDIAVHPRASRARIGPVHGDRVKVAVTSPPVDGEANEAVIELFAKTLRMPRRQVSIVSGQRSRKKTVRIEGARAEEVMALLSPEKEGAA